MSNDSYIRFANLIKEFPGCRALDDVSFSIRKGEVRALIGENGAGKSTLLNILHGIYRPTKGKVYIDGEETEFHAVFDATRAGIVKVHQEINLVPGMTVAQNIMLGSEPRKYGFIDYAKMNEESSILLKKLNAPIDPTMKVAHLKAGEMQIIQIAKALQQNAKIISMDEPTSSLSSKEVHTLFDIINELKLKGITIIYITHRIDEIYKIADRVTVMRDGKYINTFDLPDTAKEVLLQNMIGRDVSVFAVRHKQSQVQEGDYVLEAKNLKVNKQFEDISFKLQKGEILGFFGLVGSKRTDVMRAIFGADKLDSGELYINGARVENKNPFKAISSGISLIPEERKTQGFVKTLTNAENITLPSLGNFMKFFLIDHKGKIATAVEYAKSVNVKPPDPNRLTFNMSGGNQQKVILAKWLSADTDIMILDEPTKGIDIGAKEEIYNLMEELVESGKSIIMVSSELPEVMGMSDRLIIMHEGKISAELTRGEFKESTILSMALGGSV